MPRQRPTELVHIGADAVLSIHAEVIEANGGAPGIRDRGLLLSAVAAPQASFGGTPMFPDALQAAAAYLFYLCRNHPFVDGNKRTAVATCLVFLQFNDERYFAKARRLPLDSWEALVMDVAASRLDRETTEQKLRALLR